MRATEALISCLTLSSGRGFALDRYIQSRRRLIGDQDLRIARQRHAIMTAVSSPAETGAVFPNPLFFSLGQDGNLFEHVDRALRACCLESPW